MIYFSGGKINLGLNVVSKREDGYHNIESIFYPIPIFDVLEVIPSKQFKFQYTGVEKIPGVNLVEKAFNLLKKEYKIPNCLLHLHKNIPIGAGLAGGSGNGTQAIIALNELFHLNISKKEIENLALELGSDCPFFSENKPKLINGRGEIMSAVNLDLSGYFLLLVNPKIHISTKEAYKNLQLSVKSHSSSPKNIINKPIEDWGNYLKNDFEEYSFNVYPEIGFIKDEMYKKGALYASMTGTGSTVYGIFEKTNRNFSFSNNYYFKWVSL